MEAHSKPSMKKLVPLVTDMATNWYELGAMLLEEKEEAQLKIIEGTHGNNVKKCCMVMLKYWIDKHPKATWHQLVTALRSSGVDLDSVATSIEEDFTSYTDHIDADVQNPTIIDFAKCANVVDAFATLIRVSIKELRKADFETVKILCLLRADKELKNKISSTTNINNLIELLNHNPVYFNWMNVEYLHTMATAADDTNLQDIVTQYNELVLSKTLGEVWSSKPCFKKTRAKYYDKIRAEFRGEDPDNIKVEDLYNRKPRFAQKIAMHIIQITKGSLAITWCITAVETYKAYLLALNIPQQQRNDDFLQIGAWVVFHPQYLLQELKKCYAMVTTPALLVSYYCGLLLREIDADLLINTMCSDGLLTPHEQAIISSGHSVHQRNLMLLEYTQHMDMQSLMSFCKLVQEMWPQVGSKLITALHCEALVGGSFVATSDKKDSNKESAEFDTTSPVPTVCDNTYCEALPITVYFTTIIHQIGKLLRYYPLKLVQLCETLKASNIHDINLFTTDQIKEMNGYNNTVLLFVKLNPLVTWSNHSVLRVLASCCDDALKLLDNFDFQLNLHHQITSYPIPCLSSNMIPSDTSTYTILAIRCKVELYESSLQYIYDVQSVMIEECDITQHCLQLLAVRSDPTILYWTIPKCVVDLINTNVPLHSEYLYSRGILEVLVYPDLLLTTGDDVCYGSLAFEYVDQSFDEKVADLATTSQKNEAMLRHAHMKYSNLYAEYEDNKKYTAVLEHSLKKLEALKNEEKDISKDEHSQTAQESQSAIKEVESTMEFTMLKKQKDDEDLYEENEKLKNENMDLRIKVNQLQEEIADTDPRFKVEQLQKEKKELQHLVNKYQTQKHICTETASIATQTDEKQTKILCPGMKGVIVTCNGPEKSCATEACKLLNEFANTLYPPKVQDHASKTANNVTIESDADTSKELKQLKEKPYQKRFHSVECGARNVVFIQCEEPSVCPSDLIHYMLSNVKASGIPSKRYKHFQCVLPITHTCRAFQNDIVKCAREMVAPHFHIPDKMLQFAVVCKSRNNSEIIKKNVIHWIAETVTKGTVYNHTVNLDSPDLVILVEIIKSVCCMSIVKDFTKLRKYNIQELTMSPAEEEDVKT